MYVADLVSMPAERSKGYGNQMFNYLEDTAKEAGCTRYDPRLNPRLSLTPVLLRIAVHGVTGPTVLQQCVH